MIMDRDHVCVLDRHERGMPGCRCGRWYTPLRGELLTYAFVSPTLRDRNRDYRLDIKFGKYPDLRAAVKAAAAREAEADALWRAGARERWERKQRSAYPRFIRAAKSILLVPGARCAYCGRLNPETLDHIMPVSRWPALARVFRNLCPACKSCNAEKWNRTPAEWMTWRRNRGLPYPPIPAEVAAFPPRAPAGAAS
jgi:5-methylcytosine-specific restriction endonuclease McrA